MKVYIAGPMTGLPSFNIPAFDAAARDLRAKGYDVVSPAELDDPTFRRLCLKCPTGSMEELHTLCWERHIPVETWGDLLARDVKLLADGDIETVVVLPGWEQSKGAKLEVYVAKLCGLPVRDFHPTIPLYTQARNVFLPTEKWSESHPTYRMTPEGPEEIRRVDPKTGGEKCSKDEVLGDAAPEALKELAKVYGFGRTKYARLNYLKGYDWSLSYDALQRHLHAFWGKENIDPESKLHHLAHACWHCLALMTFDMRKLGKDDRP